MEPPNKRPRRSVSPERARTHSHDFDVEEARRVNDLRLKSRFEDIFEKYGKDFGPVGDEIDLRTGEIIINNGHLQEMENERDVGRGMWDDFHPDDDVETTVNTVPSLAGTYSAEVAAKSGVENGKSDAQPTFKLANFDSRDHDDGQSLKDSWQPDTTGRTLNRIPSRKISEEPNSHGGIQRTQSSPLAEADVLTYGRPASSGSTPLPGVGRDREGEKSLPSPDFGTRFTSTLRFATPTTKQSAKYRSPSPPGSGSIWALPKKAGRKPHKSNQRNQPRPTDSSRREQISRESPDSDDPLTERSTLTPKSKTAPPQQQRDPGPVSFNSSKHITKASTPHADDLGQDQPHATHFEHDQEQMSNITGTEKFHTPPEQLTEASECEASPSPAPDHLVGDAEVDGQETALQPDTTNPVGRVEVQIYESEGLKDAREEPPDLDAQSMSQTNHVTAQDHDITSPAKSTPKTPRSKEHLGGHLSTSFNPSPIAAELSPNDMKSIIELRVTQKLPWQRAFNKVTGTGASPIQLKHLYSVRQKLKRNESEESQSWTAEERDMLESIRPTTGLSWESLKSSFPGKSLEDLQREWIRMSLNKVTTSARRDNQTPNDLDPVSMTPTKTVNKSSNNTAATPTPSDPLEGQQSTSDPQIQRSESPDPLSVALEDATSGSGLSTMQIDTPPKSAQKRRTRPSLSNDASSPLRKRAIGTLT